MKMTILPILVVPDPRLKQVCEPVKQIDDDLLTYMQDMVETMYASDGIGLAAAQVNCQKRLFVADVQKDDEPKGPHFFLNPEILEYSDEKDFYEEGCLSIPGQFADIERPVAIKLRYMNEKGDIIEKDFDKMMARVIQHEIDHLDGVLFVDHLPPVKKSMLIKRGNKFAKKVPYKVVI